MGGVADGDADDKQLLGTFESPPRPKRTNFHMVETLWNIVTPA